MASHTLSNPEHHYRETAKKILTHPVKINTSMGHQVMSLMEADHLVANGHAHPRDLEKGFVHAVRVHANPDAAQAAKPRKITPKMLAAQAMSKVVLKRVHEKLKAQGCNIRKIMFDEWAVEHKRDSKYEAWAAKALTAVQSGQATVSEAATAVGEKVSGEDLSTAPAATGGTGAKRSRRKKGESAQVGMPISTEAKENRGRRNRRNPDEEEKGFLIARALMHRKKLIYQGVTKEEATRAAEQMYGVRLPRKMGGSYTRSNPGMFGVVENDGKFHLTGPGGEAMGKYYMSREKADLEAAKMNSRV